MDESRLTFAFRVAQVKAPRAVVVTAIVAALVTAGALVSVYILRIQRGATVDEIAATPTTTTTTDSAATCGTRPCEVLTSVPVGGTTVELLADASGLQGRLRVLGPGSTTVLETALAGMGVKLTQRSLSCRKGRTSVCLVSGGHDGGMAGEVFVAHRNDWQPADLSYFSSVGYLDLIQVSGDSSAEIAVAQQPRCGASAAECAGLPIIVEVFQLDGSTVGCTPEYAALTQLPGWPDVELTDAQLQPCST